MTDNAGAVFITGGGGGLGARVAFHYATQGWRVAIAGRDLSRLQRVATACAGLPGEVRLFALDVRNGEAVNHAVTSFAPTALVCCAAILGQVEPGEMISPKLFCEVQETNVGGRTPAMRPCSSGSAPHGPAISSP
jgi:NAD(P)-dependent dehydrogenase (short-subunit alcohol dehydrogenase family)